MFLELIWCALLSLGLLSVDFDDASDSTSEVSVHGYVDRFSLIFA